MKVSELLNFIKERLEKSHITIDSEVKWDERIGTGKGNEISLVICGYYKDNQTDKGYPLCQSPIIEKFDSGLSHWRLSRSIGNHLESMSFSNRLVE